MVLNCGVCVKKTITARYEVSGLWSNVDAMSELVLMACDGL